MIEYFSLPNSILALNSSTVNFYASIFIIGHTHQIPKQRQQLGFRHREVFHEPGSESFPEAV